MASTYLSLHYHLIFSTKDRIAYIHQDWQDRLHAYLGGIVRDLGIHPGRKIVYVNIEICGSGSLPGKRDTLPIGGPGHRNPGVLAVCQALQPATAVGHLPENALRRPFLV